MCTNASVFEGYELMLHCRGQSYHYGDGDSWNYGLRFPIEAGGVFVHSEMKVVIDRLDYDKGVIYFTFYRYKDRSGGFCSDLSLDSPKRGLISNSSSGGANEFFWIDSEYIDILIVEKESKE